MSIFDWRQGLPNIRSAASVRKELLGATVIDFAEGYIELKKEGGIHVIVSVASYDFDIDLTE
jgi:hypothetical protein